MARMHLEKPVSPRAASALALLTSVALGGCLSVASGPRAIDAPLPISTAQPCVGKVLKPGERCFFIVQAENKASRTGLDVAPGQRYRIEVPAAQFWFDKERRVPAPQGDDGSWLTRHAGITKRHPESAWFALIAGTDDGFFQDVSRTGTLVIGGHGELLLYPNDAAFAYGNNHGRILVSIQRCASDGECAPGAAR